MMRSILLVSSLLLVAAAQGGASQDDDAEWATATLVDCAVESTGAGSFDECAVESADARLARRMHPARMVTQPSRPDRRVEGDSGYSTAANIASLNSAG